MTFMINILVINNKFLYNKLWEQKRNQLGIITKEEILDETTTNLGENIINNGLSDKILNGTISVKDLTDAGILLLHARSIHNNVMYVWS